ncbi:hypothetical protein CIRMBP1271_01527 [Enterococcus cecorum]|nr:hypothetical protein CIRMBP1274_00342 [Enterococcus cecorum]CAI3299246.1 hypothetical protein CIRMBP1276_00535 [Enterococcus cecorum]CAI3310151.1 hypothetical protein CIRMBP1267_00625 [Enterococcus cecorum]CAI3389326.1 hypothetical protein CIRMBP1265_01521 [Enterococcus cecorum]CAI3393589.1 hypothetical protein CIRMBP1240_01546 [Enterococcus cecorum]
MNIIYFFTIIFLILSFSNVIKIQKVMKDYRLRKVFKYNNERNNETKVSLKNLLFHYWFLRK